MKLKYYLRGLGIGILVTAFIFIATPSEKEVLSDMEIRARALQLGMVDSSSMTLADMQGTKAETSDNITQGSEAVQPSTEKVTQGSEAVQPSTETTTQENEATQPGAQTTTQENEAAQTSTEEATPESEVATASTEQTTEQSPVVVDGVATLVIKSGTHSYAVAKDLQAAGLIEDALAFDNYLCNNGYSRSISTGTYKIALGTTEEEIAKIISRKQ